MGAERWEQNDRLENECVLLFVFIVLLASSGVSRGVANSILRMRLLRLTESKESSRLDGVTNAYEGHR